MRDWFGRVGLLVLSGLATLALIGSVMSATSGPGTTRADEAMSRQMPVADRDPAPQKVRPATPPRFEGVADDGATVVASRAAPQPRDDRERDRWLRALTYAVLALTGFVAAGLLVLLRITAHLSRIAGAR